RFNWFINYRNSDVRNFSQASIADLEEQLNWALFLHFILILFLGATLMSRCKNAQIALLWDAQPESSCY
ncbi:MAG: hypothetical protein WBB29_01525, partial [Geitlerinemataceae cyanobacterium]